MLEDFSLVSVIVPVYNAEATVESCVQSILRQEYPHLEVLVVNDGSRDHSLGILQRLAAEDPRVKVFDQPNGGVASARNLALANASGTYVQFVDSDDTLPSTATGSMVQAMEAHQCDMAIARYREIISGSCHLRGHLKTDSVMTQPQFLAQMAKRPNSFYYAALWNKLYRRDIICRNHIICDPALPWGEDFAFNTCYMAHAKSIAVLERPVYDYVRNPKGLAFTTGSRVLLHPVAAMGIKMTLYRYYKELYTAVGLYEEYRRILPRYLFGVTISG